MEGLLDKGFTEFLRVGSLKKIARPILPYSPQADGLVLPIIIYKDPSLHTLKKIKLLKRILPRCKRKTTAKMTNMYDRHWKH